MNEYKFNKILVIEDDQSLNKLIKRILEREGFETGIVSTGKELLSIINKNNNDLLLLLDYKLPDFDAYEIINRLNGEKLKIPFIIMTGVEDTRMAVNMMKIGACDYLIKDSNFLELLPAVIKRVINELINKDKLLKIEQSLTESEERYKGIVENIPLLIYRFLPDNGLISFVNNSFCLYFNKKREDLIGKNFLELADDRYHNEIKKNFTSLSKKKQFLIYEYVVNTPNGQRWIRWINQAIFNEDYKIIEYQAIGEDITERRRTLIELMESESKFRELFNNMSSGVAIYQPINNGNDFIFIDINRSCENIEKIKKESIIGKNIIEVFPGVKNYGIIDVFKRVYKTGNPEHLPESIYSDDRITGWRENYVFKLISGEIVTIYDDVTEKKIAEEQAKKKEEQLLQAEKMASIGILLSGIAHEINNPNNFILLNSTIIKDLWNEVVDILDKYYNENKDFKLSGMPYIEVKEDIQDIIKGLIDGANRIKNIIENVKEFIKPDKGTWDQVIDINKIIKSSIVITNNIVKNSTDNFTVEYGENIPNITGNTQQLEQVIINLIVNSCQALQDKSKKIKISTKFNEENKTIEITVYDEGIGIPNVNLKNIFDPFFTTKAENGGTGLGLSISYNIIKKFNGELIFKSDVKNGTTAIIYLPVDK